MKRRPHREIGQPKIDLVCVAEKRGWSDGSMGEKPKVEDDGSTHRNPLRRLSFPLLSVARFAPSFPKAFLSADAELR